jgi:hypothetical protein
MLCQLELLARADKSDFAFAMNRMRPATRAEFLNREFIGLLLFIFGGGVVAPFASVARHPD